MYTSEELRNGMFTCISVENIALIFCALHLKSVSIFSILDYPQHERNFARRYKRPMPCQSDFSLTIIVTPKPWSTHDKPIRSLSPQHLTRQIQPWAYTETKRVRPVSRRGRHGFPKQKVTGQPSNKIKQQSYISVFTVIGELSYSDSF